MTNKTYTTADIETGIHRALEADDMEAVVGLLRLLLAADPHRAEIVLDIVRIAHELKERTGETLDSDPR